MPIRIKGENHGFIKEKAHKKLIEEVSKKYFKKSFRDNKIDEIKNEDEEFKIIETQLI